MVEVEVVAAKTAKMTGVVNQLGAASGGRMVKYYGAVGFIPRSIGVASEKRLPGFATSFVGVPWRFGGDERDGKGVG